MLRDRLGPGSGTDFPDPDVPQVFKAHPGSISRDIGSYGGPYTRGRKRRYDRSRHRCLSHGGGHIASDKLQVVKVQQAFLTLEFHLHSNDG